MTPIEPRRRNDESVVKSPGDGERGSAFIVALLVLFALTVVGLALTFVTQTESLIGSLERNTERAFFAADAGLEAVVAQALNQDGDCRALRFDFDNPVTMLGSAQVDQAWTEPLAEIGQAVCDLCSINQDQEMYRIVSAASSEGYRYVGQVGGPTARDGVCAGTDCLVPIAMQEASMMVDIQPRRKGIRCAELLDRNNRSSFDKPDRP